MNEEYLWDKSGEPDPDIQQLEQILGTLRYEPKPLDLGNEVQPRHRELAASNVRHRSKSNVVSDKEALLAKEQLMSALRIASEKLNLAQRKAQGPTPNQIRNQHKIG